MLGIVIAAEVILRRRVSSTAERSWEMTAERRPTSGEAGRPRVSRARRRSWRGWSEIDSATLL